jgi:hypothetical protein
MAHEVLVTQRGGESLTKDRPSQFDVIIAGRSVASAAPCKPLPGGLVGTSLSSPFGTSPTAGVMPTAGVKHLPR